MPTLARVIGETDVPPPADAVAPVVSFVRDKMPRLRTLFALAALAAPLHAQRILVGLPANAGSLPKDGRLLLLLSTDSVSEPRFEINYHDNTQQIFGIDVHDLTASHP